MDSLQPSPLFGNSPYLQELPHRNSCTLFRDRQYPVTYWYSGYKDPLSCPSLGFPGGANGKEPACLWRRHKRLRFNPSFRKIPWRRTWQPTPVVLPRESHGQRSLVGYSPWGCKESGMTEVTEHVHLSQSRTTLKGHVIFRVPPGVIWGHCWDYMTDQPLLCLTLCDPMDCKYARLPYPPLSPGICSNSCPMNRWCFLTISSSVVPFSFCPRSFPASGSFPVSQLFTSGGQSIGTLTSASVLPMNIQGWFPLGLTGLISLLSRGLSRVFSSTTVWQHQFICVQPAFPCVKCLFLPFLHRCWSIEHSLKRNPA